MIAFRANLPDALRRATQEAVRLTRDTGTRYAVTFEPGLLAPHRRASAAYVVATAH